MMGTRDVVLAWFERVWNQRDAAAIDELRAVDADALGLREDPMRGLDSFREFHALVLSAFPRLHIEVEDIVVEGDRAAVMLSFHAERGGRSFAVKGMGMITVRSGKIILGENLWDVARLLAEIGGDATPAATTLPRALALLTERVPAERRD